ncbi:MAG: NAD(P)/FAD-dependent oxidoreductase [Woeseiaceae bacterium]|nr:NAD(P)/FAD-dependent oxidoreductase [Woeseiaceae bacterium]
MTERFDAIVVGAGHNGLVCAALLAKAGKKVLVLEARDEVGGAAVTRPFADGFSVSAGAHLLHQLQPKVMKALGVTVPLTNERLSTVALSGSGEHLFIDDHSVAGASDKDAEAFTEFMGWSDTFARFLNRQLMKPPPRLGSGQRKDTIRLARLGLDLRMLGRADMRDFLQLIGQNIYDELDARFDSELLKGAIALDAVTGTHTGPRSPGSLVTWLYRLCTGGHVSQPAGGLGAVSKALADRAEALGVTIQTGVPVDRIVVDNGRVVGVDTAEGRVSSWKVISNADPKTTVFGLVGARHFESTFVRRVHHLRSKGNVAKLHLGLDALPDVAGLRPEDYGGRFLLAPSADAVERAFNPAKYGRCSSKPVFEVCFPSVSDDSCAPAGKHVLSALVQFAPYDHEGGWTDVARADFLDGSVAALDEAMPGLRERILHSELRTPVDLEAEFGVSGGHWHHGELGLDQFMFVRPVAGAAQYRMPLDGLYLCGAGTHPGGGVTGAPGYNAAQVILERERSR